MPGGDGTGPIGGGSGQNRKGFGMGPGGDCICPNCGHREPHHPATPCYTMKCPKCGAPMSRV